MIEFPIPALTQGSDQSAMITISDVIEPGFLVKNSAARYVMRVPGDPRTDDLDEAEKAARARFIEMLGVLRAKKHGRGELAAEVDRSPAYDEHGNVVVRVGTAKSYVAFPGDMERFASNAADGMAQSSDFRDALRLFGESTRDSAAYYMIYELAKKRTRRQSGDLTQPRDQQ